MKKIFLITIIILLSLGSLFSFQAIQFGEGKLRLVFCDVGQGDAIFIRTPGNLDILVDGGPNDSVLTCLTNNMPFWDKTLELVILTHPHADHLNGLISVFENYEILEFATENLKNKTQGFKYLMDLIERENINMRFLYAGDKFRFKDGVALEIVGPTNEFLELTSPQGFIGESGEFASVETLIKYRDFSALLAGDSQARQLKDAIDKGYLTKTLVLQVPHHGSKSGLDSEILDILMPELAVISVGKNRYGHPNALITQLLKDKGIKTLRTDRDGEVKITSDGNTWSAQ
ncbi:MBL fold metallo-hydrolase [Candidatus Roizmanbacteria bacterium]|nr:MBL fold metallo-hydrolase [Candidatus Roizmanbacteria bacterium]